jgi:hypothetical protein
VFEELLALVLHISERLATPLPSRDPTTYLYLPFKKKATLFRYLRGVYDESAQAGNPVLATPPCYSTFVRATRHEDFVTTVRWLQVVWHAKCADCAYYKYQLRSMLPPLLRSQCESEYMEHLKLALEQKHAYYRLRLRAMLPEAQELFLVADGPRGRLRSLARVGSSGTYWVGAQWAWSVATLLEPRVLTRWRGRSSDLLW